MLVRVVGVSRGKAIVSNTLSKTKNLPNLFSCNRDILV